MRKSIKPTNIPKEPIEIKKFNIEDYINKMKTSKKNEYKGKIR